MQSEFRTSLQNEQFIGLQFFQSIFFFDFLEVFSHNFLFTVLSLPKKLKKSRAGVEKKDKFD